MPDHADETIDGEPTPKSVAAHPLPARALDDDEYRTFLSIGRRERFAAGECLFEYGTAASCMYVVESGEVRLHFGEGMADKVVQTQQYFGELAVFTGHHQRMAGAVAETDALVWAIDQVAFEALLAQQPGLMAGFMRRSFS